MNFKPRGIARTVVLLLAFIGVFAGLFVSQHFHFNKKINPAEFHGTYLEHPRTINSFNLTGIDEKTFDNMRLNGHWTMMFFGFTQCGYLCPTIMAELGKMYRMLEDKGVNQLPQVIMISIDPKRDGLDKLSRYVKAFHPRFYGATGEEGQLERMAHEMGIAYTKIFSTDKEHEQSYDIQHSGAIILFNPQGELNAFFTTPHRADLMARDYLMLIS